MRLTADADPELWMPVTWPAGASGGRHRRAAIKLLQSQHNRAWAQLAGAGGKAISWVIRRLMPRAIYAANGTMLVWAYRPASDRLVAMATIQPLTAQLRAARASMPMEYDDTERFPGALGVGEKLFLPRPSDPNVPPIATYTWDTGELLITVSGLSTDGASLGEFVPALDALARTVRLDDGSADDETPGVIRLPPA